MKKNPPPTNFCNSKKLINFLPLFLIGIASLIILFFRDIRLWDEFHWALFSKTIWHAKGLPDATVSTHPILNYFGEYYLLMPLLWGHMSLFFENFPERLGAVLNVLLIGGIFFHLCPKPRWFAPGICLLFISSKSPWLIVSTLMDVLVSACLALVFFTSLEAFERRKSGFKNYLPFFMLLAFVKVDSFTYLIFFSFYFFIIYQLEKINYSRKSLFVIISSALFATIIRFAWTSIFKHQTSLSSWNSFGSLRIARWQEYLWPALKMSFTEISHPSFSIPLFLLLLYLKFCKKPVAKKAIYLFFFLFAFRFFYLTAGYIFFVDHTMAETFLGFSRYLSQVGFIPVILFLKILDSTNLEKFFLKPLFIIFSTLLSLILLAYYSFLPQSKYNLLIDHPEIKPLIERCVKKTSTKSKTRFMLIDQTGKGSSNIMARYFLYPNFLYLKSKIFWEKSPSDYWGINLKTSQEFNKFLKINKIETLISYKVDKKTSKALNEIDINICK